MDLVIIVFIYFSKGNELAGERLCSIEGSMGIKCLEIDMKIFVQLIICSLTTR